MKGGMGSTPFCSEFWLNVVLVVKGVDLEEVTKFIFAFKMYGVPEIGRFRKYCSPKTFPCGYILIPISTAE